MEPTKEAPSNTKGGGLADLLRHCLNPKVLLALGGVGVAIWLVQPQLIHSVAPVLLALACPLSMILMMRAMRGGAERKDGAPGSAKPALRDRHDVQ